MPELSQRAIDLLDPALKWKVIASYQQGDETYFVIVQSNDDIGGEILIKEFAQGAQIIKSGTTVFPLTADEVPGPVVRALSGLPTKGARQIEGSLRQPLPAGITQDQLNARVYDQAVIANGTLHTDVPGTEGGALACAWAVNEVVTRALGRPVGGGLSTDNMFEVLQAKHRPITEEQTVAGTIIISPTQGKNIGHVGIVGKSSLGGAIGSTVIYSNRSSAALFGDKFTIASWHDYFGTKHLPVLYFELDPLAFEAPVVSSLAADWTPPGLNVIADIYAGDARQPDFARIRSAGIFAFIHKATDPIYRFNSDLYMTRRAQALAAGLLWGSYHFGRTGDSGGQADDYLDAVQPEDNEFICLDFELDKKRPDTVMSLEQAADFIKRVEQRLGKAPFLYGGNYLRESLKVVPTSPLTVCNLWFADYRQRPSPEIPQLWKSWSFWQYAGDIPAGHPGSLPTLDNTDRSAFNGNEQQLRSVWRCRPPTA